MSWQPLEFAVENPKLMLDDYRTWLESELKLLGNASHHAYSFGQANMAKRALDRLDEELAGKVGIVLSLADARAAAAALDAMIDAPAASPGLRLLRERLRVAVGPASADAEPDRT